jgi:hypothetical protein
MTRGEERERERLLLAIGWLLGRRGQRQWISEVRWSSVTPEMVTSGKATRIDASAGKTANAPRQVAVQGMYRQLANGTLQWAGWAWGEHVALEDTVGEGTAAGGTLYVIRPYQAACYPNARARRTDCGERWVATNEGMARPLSWPVKHCGEDQRQAGA